MNTTLLRKDVRIGPPTYEETAKILLNGLDETNCFYRKGKQLFVITEVVTSKMGKPSYKSICIDHNFKR